ncbi:hypothetical protein A1F94_002592 [Pyrenophora tritici-repentis]|nr:hypothetical protein A1F94_002592 [Pyrenophora tritici-repentis]
MGRRGKTLQAYKKLPDQWRSRAEHLMSDDTFTKDFAKFSHKLRHLEQLHSALQPSHNPSKGNSGGHKSNSDDAPCKDMDKLTSMGRYPEVLTALNEARKAAGVPIPKAAVRINAVRASPPAAASDARSENEA